MYMVVYNFILDRMLYAIRGMREVIQIPDAMKESSLGQQSMRLQICELPFITIPANLKTVECFYL